MRLARVIKDGRIGLAAKTGDTTTVVWDAAAADLDRHIAAGTLAQAGAQAAGGEAVDIASLTFLPPVVRPSKIVCLGLNYRDHAEESGLGIPEFPVLFARFPSSLIGHGAPIILPKVSSQLDWEAELAVVLSKGGKHIAEADALSHVAGYSVFNDGSIRDYQLRTPQWTAGKNFDDTGAFGPWLVTPDELPAGAAGLKIECRVNGQVMQSSNTGNLIFDVARTIALLSGFMTLEAGDVLVMGTPGGVGVARNPQVWMKAGDVCEVEIERVGLLSNPIVAE
ncbi:fumarylacetoacetate hydrolase family protein [Novosphingobium sp. Fuku2-ISO-50]|uniref:fumarylacetoacetate hydrolase family protein n=1 Tax=Novosphingobium sp. Fuku2-ISO-50 TaxID=1739114 RepID=UPI00076CBD81|nr:fumarylacetoacetate hydrolase family protein [Novosphingobium sp. Fuku2-ISO-50]KUR76689.1 fumarylacetoacetate hydrolase [Novosphingobium sp. Fuku2-ISO-50]